MEEQTYVKIFKGGFSTKDVWETFWWSLVFWVALIKRDKFFTAKMPFILKGLIFYLFHPTNLY